MVCSHRAGDSFEVQGENLRFPDGQAFSMYALAALLPLLPAKQRVTHDNDWMTTDTDIACPDPHCGARFRITRTGETHLPARRGHRRAAAAAHMSRSEVPRVKLAPGYDISRMLKGGWQLAGGHGAVDVECGARRHGSAFVDAGITTFDCADIYTGVEALIGRYGCAWRRGPAPRRPRSRCTPSACPISIACRTHSRAESMRGVDRSLRAARRGGNGPGAAALVGLRRARLSSMPRRGSTSCAVPARFGTSG